MALSDQVKNEIDSAQRHLREALAFAARNEKTFIVKSLGEMIHALEHLSDADEFMDTVQDIMNRQDDDNQ
jgi:hypothetical protein